MSIIVTVSNIQYASGSEAEMVCVMMMLLDCLLEENRGVGQQILQGFNAKNSSEGKAVLYNVHTQAIKRGRATTGLIASMIGVM